MEKVRNVGRRGRHRYALLLQATYRLSKADGDHIAAKVLNMSSQSLLLETAEPLFYGQKVIVYIAWPAKLSDGVSLRLVVSGKVVRVEPQDNLYKNAVRFQGYEFRTCAMAHSG